ncbi:hypothetical protein AAFM79_16995 [Trichormus azollae HNT15244]
MPESKSKFLVHVISTAIVVAGGIAAYVYFKRPLEMFPVLWEVLK